MISFILAPRGVYPVANLFCFGARGSLKNFLRAGYGIVALVPPHPTRATIEELP